MKPSTLFESIKALAGIRQPFFVWGDPGVGKSQIVAQVADRLFGQPAGKGKRPPARTEYLRDLRAVLLDPVDLMGIPTVVNGRTTWAAPSILPSSGQGLLFFDELNRAPVMVQNACLQLVLDRRLGEYTLPDGWVIGAAGNYENETGVNRMPDALRSRFTHLKAETDVDDWATYASSQDFNPAVVAFIRFRRELLHHYDRVAARKENAYPCPRTWEFVGNIAAQELDAAVEYGLLCGTVGEAAATEFTSFLRLYRQLPDMDELITKPDTALVPSAPALCYAVSSALARMAKNGNVANVITYLDRMPEQEYAVLAVREMTMRDATLNRHGAITQWKVKHADVVL